MLWDGGVHVFLSPQESKLFSQKLVGVGLEIPERLLLYKHSQTPSFLEGPMISLRVLS